MKKRNITGRKMIDRAMTGVSVLVLTCSLGMMFWILWTVVQKGSGALSMTFLFSCSKPYGVLNSGIGNALLGTVLITGAALAITIVPAMAGGVYLSEFGRHSRWGERIRFCVNVMMGIPSIVIGLFVYSAVVVPMGGFSGLAGAVALSLIMFPVIMTTTEDMLRMIPDSIREGALAIGMNSFQTTVSILFRAARNGLITGVLMAFARVSGETAPLLFTALWSDSWPTRFFSAPTANLPVLITEYTVNSPFDSYHAAGWGAALIVLTFILVINIGIRIVFRTK